MPHGDSSRRAVLKFVGASTLLTLTSGIAAAERERVPLLPPPDLDESQEPDADGRAEIRSEPGRLELKIDAEDVAVIEDVADPAFRTGFYEAVLYQDGAKVNLPGFQGFVVKALVDGQFEPSHGELDFRADLDEDEETFPTSGKLEIWNVAAVRGANGEVLEGPNGEPFRIDEAQPKYRALEGTL